MENDNFQNIAGYEEEKEIARKDAQYLKNYDTFKAQGARIPKGMVLYGEPGVGKTLFAKAIAKEADVCFLTPDLASASNTDMMIQKLEQCLEEARKKKPSIIFLDRLEELIKKSNGDLESSESLTDYLLKMLDDNEQSDGVFLLATCRKFLALPRLLTEVGRMDLSLIIDVPSEKNREAIFRFYLKNYPCFNNIDASALAKATPTLTGKEISALTNAVLVVALTEQRDATMEDFLKRIPDKVNDSPEAVSAPPYREDIAYFVLGTWAFTYEHGYGLKGIRINLPMHKGTFLIEKDEPLMAFEETPDFLGYYFAGKVGEEYFTHKLSLNAKASLDKAIAEFDRMYAKGLLGYQYLPDSKGNSTPEMINGRIRVRNALFDQLVKEDKEMIQRREPLIRLLFPILMKKGEIKEAELHRLIKEYEKTLPHDLLPNVESYEERQKKQSLA